MKRKGIYLLIVAILAIVLTACTAEQPGETNINNNNNDDKPSASDTGSTDDKTESKSPSLDQEIVVVDNDECIIKITGIDPDNLWGYAVKAELENKSSDKTYMFAVESASINGVQSDPFFAEEVAAGKKSNSDISFETSTLEENGIGEFTDIELSFRVYDTDDWLADNVAEETVHIYPYGKDKATQFERAAQSGDNVIVDNEYVTVIVTGYEIDEIWGYTVNLFLVNKTDTEVMFSVEEASVNGYMADPFFATDVASNKCAFSSILWSDSTFEENGITDVEEIEFVLNVYDFNSILDDYFVSEKVTLNP